MNVSLVSLPSPSQASVVDERPEHVSAREAILDAALGPDRLLRSSERLRAGRSPASGLALSATAAGTLVGTLRLWDVETSDRPLLLLGPLAVEPARHGQGLGGLLMREAIRRAARLGHGAIILVGDPGYYRRFGFERSPLQMPGRYDQARLQTLELRENFLQGASGMLRASEPRVLAA